MSESIQTLDLGRLSDLVLIFYSNLAGSDILAGSG